MTEHRTLVTLVTLSLGDWEEIAYEASTVSQGRVPLSQDTILVRDWEFILNRPVGHAMQLVARRVNGLISWEVALLTPGHQSGARALRIVRGEAEDMDDAKRQADMYAPWLLDRVRRAP